MPSQSGQGIAWVKYSRWMTSWGLIWTWIPPFTYKALSAQIYFLSSVPTAPPLPFDNCRSPSLLCTSRPFSSAVTSSCLLWGPGAGACLADQCLQKWRCRHREQTYGFRRREGRKERERRMERVDGGIRTTICKINSQWKFAAWLGELKAGLCNNLEGWGVVHGEGTYVP